MKAKYFKWSHPITKQVRSGDSQIWRALCKIRFEVEQHLVWNIGKGDISFWYVNWTSFGPLFSHLPDGVRPLHIKLNEVWRNGERHEQETRITWPESTRNVLN